MPTAGEARVNEGAREIMEGLGDADVVAHGWVAPGAGPVTAIDIAQSDAGSRESMEGRTMVP